MYAIQVYIPDSHLEKVKQAMFTAGAGRLGSYDSCAWVAQGTGQFRPMDGSKPFLGQTGVLESVKEWKLEMICEDACLKPAIAAMKQAHPYETPAYLVLKTEEI